MWNVFEKIYSAFETRAAEEAEQPYFVRIKAPGDSSTRDLRVDHDYVSVRLRRLRIARVRKGLTSFYGCVHSFISLLDQGLGREADFNVVSTPTELMKLDAKNVNRVVTINLPLLSNVPYRGGMRLQVGLFSVKAADLAEPYLQLLETLSKTAGVSMAGTALTLAGPIRTGIDLLFGAKAIELEVGIKQAPAIIETGTYLLMRAPKGFPASQLQADDNMTLRSAQGSEIDQYPYMVISVDAAARRDDWFLIPDIKAAHDELITAVKKNKLTEVEKDLFPYFKRVCLTSPDLLEEHAEALVAEQEGKLKKVLPAMQTGIAEVQTWALSDLQPFRNS